MSPIIVNVEVNEVVVITHRTKITVFWGQFGTPNLLICISTYCMHSLKFVRWVIYYCCCNTLQSNVLEYLDYCFVVTSNTAS